MAKHSFSIAGLLGRIIKALMVVLVAPLALGLVAAVLAQAELIVLPRATFREYLEWGFLGYVGVHVLLYRPSGLFRISHRIFSAIAVWLFGGHVTSVEDAGKGKPKPSRGAKEKESHEASGAEFQGSTLVAFSPYVVPVYFVLVCVAAWGLRNSAMAARAWLDPLIAVLIGGTMAFHWLMTADDLQQQRKRWHVETYLLALGLVFVLTIVIGAACLPLAAPEFSYLQMLADGLAQTQRIYSTLVQRLFF